MKHDDTSPEMTRAVLERAFERKVQKSRWSGLVERLWPRLWLLAAVLTAFALVSTFGVWPHLGDVAHWALLAAFALALIAALVFVVRTPWPTREEAVRRIERVSGVAHRPASSYDDTLWMASGDSATPQLWRAHRVALARPMQNALGSSILLETARVAAAAAERPRRSILFLLVTGEERGLLGSDFFAHYPTVEASALVADVNVDMPLLLAPTADLVAFGAEHSSLEAVVREAVAAHGFALVPDPMPEEVIFIRSDQYSFVRQGVPSIYLTTGSGTLGGGDTQAKASAAFFSEHYHQPSDESGLGTDWDSVARFTAAQADIVRAIADQARRPTWNEGDFFGETFGRK